MTSVLIAIGTVGIDVGLGLHVKKQNEIRYEKYISTTIETKNGIHNIDDVYVVYNADKV